jgi:hypothetical protein
MGAVKLQSSPSHEGGFEVVLLALFAAAKQDQKVSTRADFLTYLNQTPKFCDGTKSQESGKTIGSTEKTVAAEFAHDRAINEGVTAATVLRGKNSPLWVFFDPQLIDGEFLHFNQAMIFHEALHGWSKIGDSGLCQTLKIDLIPKFQGCTGHSIQITNWLEDDIMFP